MGDTQSCLRNTSSHSSLDMAKELRSSLPQGHVFNLNWEGSNTRQGDLINLEDGNDDFLNSEESPTGSLPKTPRGKGKKSSVDDVDWSVPRRFPRGVTHENFQKPKLLSHGARRERLEELKRLNQQLKSSPRNSRPPKYQPVRKTVSYSDPGKSSEGSKRPSLIELEVQALASLGFVKLQPDIAVEPGPSQKLQPHLVVEPSPSQNLQADIVVEPGTSQQNSLSDAEQLDPRRADPSATKRLEIPKEELQMEDSLALEKVARRSMKYEIMAQKSPQEVGSGSDLLELQKVALASMKVALHPEAVLQVLPSPPQESAKGDMAELQKKSLSRGTCLRHPEPTTPGPSQSQEVSKVKCLSHPPMTPCASKPPLPPPPQDLTGKSNVIEPKVAQQYRRCKLHPNGEHPKPSLATSSEGMPSYNLSQPPRKCLLHPSTAPLQPSRSGEIPQAIKSVITPSHAPLYPPPESDLLELQKVALASMKQPSNPSASHSGVAPAATSSAPSQPIAPDRGDLLELEIVALAKMKEICVFPSSQLLVEPAIPSITPATASDILELQKVALASVKASAKPSEEGPIAPGPQPAAKRNVESATSDLLELQRMALANMLAASKQDGEGELKVKTSKTLKDDVQYSVTPTSSCSSFHLEPASGPLETMLVELTSKDKALQAANKKVAEKEQLLHEYEGELSRALKMLESMSVRCTDAKEETARALSEAKHIYDELSQAWSAVEGLEATSKDGVAVSPEKVVGECSKQVQKFSHEKDKKLEDERKKWIEDFLEELERIESARSGVQRDFDQQIRKDEKIMVELQHLRATPSVEDTLEAYGRECPVMHGLTDDHEHQSNSGQEECYHVFLEHASISETETKPETRSLESTSNAVVVELWKIESAREENQNPFQEQMDRNQQVVAQLQELQSYYQEDEQQQASITSEQQKQWEDEEAQLNARISVLHEALEELHEALYEKTKEANELHAQTLRLQRFVLEQEQRLIRSSEHYKTDSSRIPKSATVDFSGDTSELEAAVCPSYSSTPDKTDFVGDTVDLECYVCSTCSLAEYICANCSTEPIGSDTTLTTKFCPSVKAATADFECDTRDLGSVVYTIDFEGDTRELELERTICTMDIECDTKELEVVLNREYREDKSVQVRRDDREKKRLAQDRENWEAERKVLIKRLDDFEANLVAKEEKIGNLIEKLERGESTWQEEKYQLVKRAEECETRLLAKEEEVIELSTQLEMAKSTLQGFTSTDSSTLVSTSSDISTAPPLNKKRPKLGIQAIQRVESGRSDTREILDLRCEVLSLHECLVIKGEAMKTMENELSRSYTVINDLRTKLARAQESERSLLIQQNIHRLVPDDSPLTNGQSLGQKLKGKVAKKPRLLRDFDQSTTRPNQNQAELLEKLRVQSEKLAALEKERAIMSRKIEDLTAKCKYLEEIEKMYRGIQDPLKAEAIMELEKELERNVEIIKKVQLRCSEFEARAVEAENKLKQVQSDDNSTVPEGDGAKEKKAWQAEREGLLAGLKFFREQAEKKDEELYELRYELRAKKQKQLRTPPPACKSSLTIESPETRNGSVVEMVVHDTNAGENSNFQLARVHAPTATILEFERRDDNRNQHSSCDHEDGETRTSPTLQIRELTEHLRDQWKLESDMEDRLDALMAYVSDRVKEFEQQSRNVVAPSANFAQFYDEARLMKSQLEQQLQVLRGTLSTSFRKLDEAKRQLQVAAAAKEVQSFVAGCDTTERSADNAAVAEFDNMGKAIQVMSEKVALEDSAQNLEEKTSRLLHRLTSTRLQWNMNMLAASMAAG